MNDGTSYEGKVIGGDADNDVALVKIEAKGLSAATLGNSNEMEVERRCIPSGTRWEN